MSDSEWVPDLRGPDFLDSTARARIALAMFPQACALLAAGKITKPEKGSGPWRAACVAFNLADAFLAKWKGDTEPQPAELQGAAADGTPF